MMTISDSNSDSATENRLVRGPSMVDLLQSNQGAGGQPGGMLPTGGPPTPPRGQVTRHIMHGVILP